MTQTELETAIATRLASVRTEIDAAIARRGSGPAVRLLGVSKRQPIAALRAAAAAGLRDFGENYAQELRDKRAALADHPALRWHFIGALQSNKVKHVLGSALVHTIDRVSLLTAMDRRLASDPELRQSLEQGVQSVLVEVNVAGEASKAGVSPDALPTLLDAFADLDHVRCCGLMVIPPAGTPEQTRPHFRALRGLAELHARTHRPGVELRELSMGMSGDFGVAIEEGATLVRVGTAIFGPRPSS